MRHIPYGYKIVDGEATIEKEKARQLNILFDEYIAGATIAEASQISGIGSTHSVIGRMLNNIKYVGTDFYPTIIDKRRFKLAAEERDKRAKALGRIRDYSAKEDTLEKNYTYHLDWVEPKFDNPFRQAEYAYSLIEREEIDG